MKDYNIELICVTCISWLVIGMGFIKSPSFGLIEWGAFILVIISTLIFTLYLIMIIECTDYDEWNERSIELYQELLKQKFEDDEDE